MAPRILVFDIFGTVVDWHGSIVREVGQRFAQVDADAFARAWRAGYQPAMEAVRSGGRGFVKLDVLHREILDGLLPRFTICSLSNGNLGLLTDMAKAAGLPWDCVLSAEVFRAYKPDPRVYLGAAEVFEAEPGEVVMVAAHHDDLAAARACGLQTAYIERPLEFGAAHVKDVSPQPGNTWHARDLRHLAEQLGC